LDMSKHISEGKEVKLKTEEIEISDQRELVGFWKLFAEILAVSFVLFYIYNIAFGIISIMVYRSLFIGITLAATFLSYPMYKKKSHNENTPNLLDIFLVVLSFAIIFYFVYRYPAITFRAGLPPTLIDIFFGVSAILLCIEGSRRILGNVLPMVTIFFIAYTLFGHLSIFPESIRHSGVGFGRFIYYQYNTMEGIFGTVASVCANYVLIFLFLGAFLEKTGVGDFFMDIAFALTGNAHGGPAKAAVISSALFGTLSGSAVANTVATGSFTIPLMIKTGYKPSEAGAIEPAASTGGQFMPPIMGAGAFLMVEFTGISYLTIIKSAFIPAILYFFGVFLIVGFEAKKYGLRGIQSKKKALDIFKAGWFYLLPIFVVILLLIKGLSPQYAGLWALVASIVTKFIGILITKDEKFHIKDFYDALINSARNARMIGVSVGTIGIIVGCIFMTGIGIRFSSLIIGFSHGILPLAIILVALASLVLGMGMSVTASYILVSVLVVPALVKLGVPILSAHFIAFWCSQYANLTPPVCVAAYAGAAIAKANPMKVGFNALKYGSALYIMPFIFAYSPGIMLSGKLINIVLSIITSSLAVISFSGFAAGFLLKRTILVERIMLFVSALLLIKIYFYTNILGIILLLIVFYHQKSVMKGGEEKNGLT